MSTCKKIRYETRKYCIGDLKELITIYNRSIQAPSLGSVDFTENFEKNVTVFATIKTIRGETVFDQSNIERVVTHHIGIRYIDGLTQESWVDIGSKRLDIINVENLDERNEWLRLVCSARGANDVETNFA